MKKHLLWFPYLLIALTVILGVTIVFVDKNRSQTEQNVEHVDDLLTTTDVSGISADESHSAIQGALDPIWPIVEVGQGNVDVVKGVREQILKTRVVAEDKDHHILIVVGLNKLVAGLEGNEEALAEAQLLFSQISDSLIWIRKRD